MSPRINIQINDFHKSLLSLIRFQIPYGFTQSLRLISDRRLYNLSVYYKIYRSTVSLTASTYQKLQISFPNIELRRLNNTRQSISTLIERVQQLLADKAAHRLLTGSRSLAGHPRKCLSYLSGTTDRKV